jgi:hypothetical protein
MAYALAMAYEFDLESDPEPPFSDALGTEIVEFALGYDLDDDLAIVMSVMLVPIDEAFDLRFGIRQKSLSQDWKVSAPDYSKECVDQYVPKQWRSLVAHQLHSAIVTLLGSVNPENVTMETYYSSLEPKALEKYEEICGVMTTCGYDTADQFRDGTSLKDYWFFQKRV